MPQSVKAQQQVDEQRVAAFDGTVKITNPAGSVRVTGWSRDSVRVTGTLGDQVADLEFTTDERSTRIRVVLREDYRDRPVGGSDLEIRVPRSSHVAVRTHEGAVRITGVAGAVDVESATGDVRIHDNPRFVYARSVGGDIEITGVSKVIRASSVAGTVAVARATGYVEISTVSGNIRLTGSDLWEGQVGSVSGDIYFEGDFNENGSFTFESNSGRIELTLSPQARADFDVSTFGGTVRTDVEGASGSDDGGRGDSSRDLVFSVNGGGARIDVQTFKGPIRITTAP